MKDKLMHVDGFAQTGLNLEPGDHPLAHRLVEEFEARLAIGLCVIHSSIGIAQEVFGCAIRGANGNSDARGGRHMPAFQIEWLTKPFKEARSDNRRVGLVSHMGEENRELVSTYTRDHGLRLDRKSTRLNSSHLGISY